MITTGTILLVTVHYRQEQFKFNSDTNWYRSLLQLPFTAFWAQLTAWLSFLHSCCGQSTASTSTSSSRVVNWRLQTNRNIIIIFIDLIMTLSIWRYCQSISWWETNVCILLKFCISSNYVVSWLIASLDLNGTHCTHAMQFIVQLIIFVIMILDKDDRGVWAEISYGRSAH